ncbi:ATP-dependent DNA ligase [Candidatus Parcubacteria bacterium]|nr:ATP-dependent DNA ligase [Patescibacteria group bacterium]MCG2689239.1 ATP-dependent DNA ligase [Candidatus Parcubacteria bacterium]
MTFSELSKYFQQIESTPKRLEMTAILASLVKDLSPDEVDVAMYLSLGYLTPPFRSTQFSVAQKLMLRAISLAFNIFPPRKTRLEYETPPTHGRGNLSEEVSSKSCYKPFVDVVDYANKVGDLGIVAQSLSKVHDSSLLVSPVYEKLKEIALENGEGSQERKLTKIASLLNQLDPISNKFVVRIILGTMRLGFSDITVIEALSWYLAGDKSLKAKIESRYRIHPDIGFLAKVIKENGIAGLKKVDLEVGVPVLVAKCARVATAEEAMDKIGEQAVAEDKYDGTRVQIHLNSGRVWTFTRNLEESTYQFPDLVEAVLANVKAENAILDAEAIGYNVKTGDFIPFQQTIKRKRKHQVAQNALDIPLTLRVFDLLYLNGESLIDKPLHERWEILRSILSPTEKIQLANRANISNSNQLLKVFENAVSRGLEGVVIKNPNAKYAVGNRGFAWIKFKREETGGLEDTIDAVVLGYYFGAGKRTVFGIGAFLIGVYDSSTDSFKTVSKIGTGLTDEQWVELKEKCDAIKVAEVPKNVAIPKELFCDVFVAPKMVVVVRADNITVSPLHTAGYAMRFPRLIEYREDKSPLDATSLKELADIYKLQKKT